MKKVLKKRTGFTLVELLIVIIIIGILAGAMLLVAGSGTDKAEATKIVSNLRSLKAATLLYYADKAGSSTVEKPDFTTTSNDLAQYMDRKLENEGEYVVEEGTGTDNASSWYVGYTKLEGKTGVKKKLEESAASSGLLAGTDDDDQAYSDGNSVYMKAR